MKTVKAIVIGAGQRGMGYTNHMANMPEKFKVVGVAEPIDSRRNYVKEKHNIPDENCYTDWKGILDREKFADLAIISTMDRMHFEPAMKAISLGYDLLLEKPISPEPEECMKIAEFAKEKGAKVLVCHVLRFSSMFRTIKSLIDEGAVGDIISINHEENVNNVHQSHSFVRGNWGNSQESSCMLLQKSCHDIDILQWLVGKKCLKVQSFGSLTYFKEKNAPVGAPKYCIDGCPEGDTCPYNAVKLYIDDKKNNWFRTSCVKEVGVTDEMIENALHTTRYGQCVFKCNNDVVDHQTVNMLFEDDVTVTFTMNAFNKGGRSVHIYGTKGELTAFLGNDSPIRVYDFETKQTEEVPSTGRDGVTGGHGGGDAGLVYDLYDYIANDDMGKSIVDVSVSADNHMTVFAAEKSRAENIVVDMEEYKKMFE